MSTESEFTKAGNRKWSADEDTWAARLGREKREARAAEAALGLAPKETHTGFTEHEQTLYAELHEMLTRIKARLPVRGYAGVMPNRCALCQHRPRKEQEACLHHELPEFFKRHKIF